MSDNTDEGGHTGDGGDDGGGDGGNTGDGGNDGDGNDGGDTGDDEPLPTSINPLSASASESKYTKRSKKSK